MYNDYIWNLGRLLPLTTPVENDVMAFFGNFHRSCVFKNSLIPYSRQ